VVAPNAVSRSRGAFRPSFSKFVVPPREQRAQGMPGARCTRGLVCLKSAHRRTRAYRAAENTPTSPAQWLYGLLRALPGERACCHRHRQDCSRRLDASIAAPGPHDFAVRGQRFVRRENTPDAARVHRIPSQRVVTMATAPPRDETAQSIILIYRNSQKYIFAKGT
jgi:hypothetical protein